MPGDLAGRILGAFRLFEALGGAELDEVAYMLAAGKVKSAHKLLMLATNTADQRGCIDAVVGEWERAHEEFEARLEEALKAPDSAAYADALYRARPTGVLAWIWSHWLVGHPRHGNEALRERARGAERQLDEDMVRCLDAWWVRLNDVFHDGIAHAGLISQVRNAWELGGRREAVRTAQQICRRRRLLPLVEVDALLSAAIPASAKTAAQSLRTQGGKPQGPRKQSSPLTADLALIAPAARLLRGPGWHKGSEHAIADSDGMPPDPHQGHAT